MNYAWPTAEIAVMGGAGAVEVLYAKEAKAAEDPAKVLAEKEQEYNKLFCNPYNAAKYGYIDDVIEPRNTRFRVIRALQQLATKKVTNPAKNTATYLSNPSAMRKKYHPVSCPHTRMRRIGLCTRTQRPTHQRGDGTERLKLCRRLRTASGLD